MARMPMPIYFPWKVIVMMCPMESKFVTDVSSSFCSEMLFSSLVNAQICAWSKIDKAAKIVQG